MRFVMAGASGFLGQALTRTLQADGHEVVALVRRPVRGAGESRWDPYAGEIDASVIEGADVVVNLAGATIAHWPFTESYRTQILDSRVKTTALLAHTVAQLDSSPALVAQCGISRYGDRGDTELDESASADGTSFLARVGREWEEAASPAAEAGSRVVVLRTGIVLDRKADVLRPLLPLFKAGLGGPVGSGDQYFSTISLRDWLAAASFLATSDLDGPFNLTGPHPATNAEFTRALASAVHRPAFFRVPAWPLKRLAGPVSDEILGSARVVPRRLLEAGFSFVDPTIETQIAAALAGGTAG